MVSALWVPAIVQVLRQAGWSDGRIARELDLRCDQIGVERRIPLEKYCALLDLAAEATGDDHFGLRFGATRALDSSTVLGYILRNSPSIGAAIRNAARYVRVHVDGVQISLMSSGPEARLVYRLTDPSIAISRHYAELLMVYAMHVFRLAAEESWSPDEVWFRHGPPADLAPYGDYFGARVRFHQSDYTTVFDRSILGRPLRAFDQQLLGILEEHAETILAQLPPLDDDLLGRLEQFVVGALPDDRAGISAAARALGMSTRTLQRRLRARGIVFAALVDEVRRRLSARYLADGTLTLGEIAWLLGYSESSAFNRAYRRWTGRSPSADRRRAAA
jgi:AraC-like DNA-binding protein